MADRAPRPSRRDEDRTRSRSPRRHDSHSHRTRSPHRHHHSSHHKRKRSPDPASASANKARIAERPFGARELSKRDLEVFRPLFGSYLEIQKQKYLEDMDDTEVRGRWKSFLGKWNRGELAEGWYDPEIFQKAVQSTGNSVPAHTNSHPRDRDTPADDKDAFGRDQSLRRDVEDGRNSDSDESIGPTLPGQDARSRGSRMGPSIPRMQDLELKREMDAEDAAAAREDMRFARKIDRKEQKSALDELVPRAEAGTRERQLEKKKELNEKMKSFREKSPGAAEVPDAELMGGGDGIESYKKQKQEFERKKNERELRKEEILRARQAERDERMQEYQAKEDSTMAMLKALAKQRFG